MSPRHHDAPKLAPATVPDLGGGAEPGFDTVVGLFDDQIDVERALVALQRADRGADSVSLIVLDPTSLTWQGDEGANVARAVGAVALTPVAWWLRGLAELVVPNRGAFLAAGPLGAALAWISSADPPRLRSQAGAADPPAANADALFRTLVDFGFGPDEATYLEQRLTSGSTLLAVTTSDDSYAALTRRLFADHDAVYLGMAPTRVAVAERATDLLASPTLTADPGAVVVADLVVPLRRLGEADDSSFHTLIDRDVIDCEGVPVGLIEEVLIEARGGPDGGIVPRYLVIGFGGVLGLGRHRVATPVGLAELARDPLRLHVTKGQLQTAPAYSEESPFSRCEEIAVFDHFTLPPYWLPT